MDEIKPTILNLLADHSEPSSGWSLAFTLGLHYPDTDRLAPALAALGTGIANIILSSADTSAAMFSLSMAAELVATRNDPALIGQYRDGLITAARTCASRYPYPVDASCLDMNASPPANLAALILETLAALSKRTSLNDAVSFLAEGLLRLADACPQAAPIWRRVVSVVYDQLPPAVTPPLWQTWLRLRALP